MDDPEAVLRRLDPATADRARSALRTLMAGGQPGFRSLPGPAVRDFLRHGPSVAEVPRGERHEIAWALGDFFALAGMPALAGICRAPETHALIATPAPSVVRMQRVRAWVDGLGRGSAAHWQDVLGRLEKEPVQPARLELALTPVRALLDAVGTGVPLTAAGHLPPRTAVDLDTRFGWSDEYAVARPSGEPDLPPLLFLHEHLQEQGLLVVRDGAQQALLQVADRTPRDPSALWRAVVDPAPRWASGFDQDALAVTAATLVRTSELTRDQLRDETAYLVGGKWRSASGGARGSAGPSPTVEDGVRRVGLAWFRVGVTLGWWDREGGLWSAKVRLSSFGRAAAASVFWAVAGSG